ncbi:hypothetical protein LLE98_01710 [Holdemanella porci]|uniref:hypothetical protein n=1 Tax=Holdemanella porci TaxID=2652276 RepID=UPI001D134CA6|nr:hypothetical protein [Holdemanella porci]MCC3360064.1 hypothetical protein [Holdemanella porci]
MTETNQLLKTIQETKSDGLNTLMESLDNLTFSQYLNHIIDAKHISKAQVLSKTTIQRNYDIRFLMDQRFLIKIR